MASSKKKTNSKKNRYQEKKEKLLKLSEEAQVARDYEKALEYLFELKKITKDEEELKELDKIIKGIQFTRFEMKNGEDLTVLSEEIEKSVKRSARRDYIYEGFKKLVILIVIIFVAFGAYELFQKYYYDNLKINDQIIDNRQLELAFLFHLNQGTYTKSDISDRVSFNSMIKTFRKHKKIKINLHVSGTLIQDLLWYNPETLELIKEGINDGQFEILGSTYSQNLLYSTDEVSNKWQIERHLEILEDVFGVKPVGFWNAERTWKQDIATTLKKYGYRYTFIEDHILRDSGTKCPEHILRTTSDKELLIINDDYDFLEYFNTAIDAGDNEDTLEAMGPNLTEDRAEYKEFFKYIRDVYEKDVNDEFVLNYAEDGEAIGDWDFFFDRRNPRFDIENLDYLLTKLEEKTWIKTVNYKDLLDKNLAKEDLTPIVDGVATWMDKAAKGKGRYSEVGYNNWFDFNANSPKLNNYRKLYKLYREMLLKYENTDNEAVKKLFNLGKEIYLTRQFEFGCTGISGTDKDWKYDRKFEMWENVRSVKVIIEAIEKTLNYEDGMYEKDVNDDNIKELVVVNNKNYYVFSKSRGGRLLYWYDLEKGIEIIGGEMPVRNEQYYDGNFPVEPFDFRDYLRFLKADKDLNDYLKNKKYYIRHKGLNEKIILDEENIKKMEYSITDIYKVEMDYIIKNENEIEFKYEGFIKNIVFDELGFSVNYTLPEEIDTIQVSSEFEPDYFEIINSGINILELDSGEEFAKIYNKKSNIGIELTFNNKEKVEFDDSIFGKIIRLVLKGKDSSIRVKKIQQEIQ